jgi:hypothetical protein
MFDAHLGRCYQVPDGEPITTPSGSLSPAAATTAGCETRSEPARVRIVTSLPYRRRSRPLPYGRNVSGGSVPRPGCAEASLGKAPPMSSPPPSPRARPRHRTNRRRFLAAAIGLVPRRPRRGSRLPGRATAQDFGPGPIYDAGRRRDGGHHRPGQPPLRPRYRQHGAARRAGGRGGPDHRHPSPTATATSSTKPSAAGLRRVPEPRRPRGAAVRPETTPPPPPTSTYGPSPA